MVCLNSIVVVDQLPKCMLALRLLKPYMSSTKKGLCAHGPFGIAIHHVWYDNVTYIVWAAGTVLPLLFEIFLLKILQYVSPQK